MVELGTAPRPAVTRVPLARTLGLAAVVTLVAAVALFCGARTLADRSRAIALTGVPPAEAKMYPERVAALADRIMAQRSEAFLVLRDGRLVVERYAQGAGRWPIGEELRLRSIASVAKALIGGTVLALGTCDGWLKPDQPAAEHVMAWANNPTKQALTLRELASHTSGLADAPTTVDVANATRTEWAPEFWEQLDRRAPLALYAAPLLAAAGREVRYSNPGYTVYSIAIAKAAATAGHSSDIEGYLQQRVMDPLGIPPSAWSFSYDRTFLGDGVMYRETGGGARFTARAAARVAELVAHGGRYQGRTIIPNGCLADILKPNLEARHAGPTKADLPAPAPAAGWWSNANGAWPELPPDLIVAAGAEHRVVVVVPSLGLVSIRLGQRLGDDQFGGDFWRRLHAELLQPLLASVRQEPEPPDTPVADSGR